MLKHQSTKSKSTHISKPFHKSTLKHSKTIIKSRPQLRTNRILNQIAPFSTSSTSTSSQSIEMENIRVYTKDEPILPNFDYVVVGGGSGGIASARRAASYGAKVAIIEAAHLGGTCVNVGCVPKKLMWYAAHIGHSAHDAEDYGFDQLLAGDNATAYNWKTMKTKRDAYIHRLNGIYYRNALRDGIYIIRGRASFDKDDNGEVDMNTLVIHPTDENKIDISDKYLDGFKIEEFKGKEVFVNNDKNIKIKLNSNKIVPASYTGSLIDSTPNTTPLQSTTNFIMTAPGGYPTKLNIPGQEYVSTSDNFFQWEKQPRRICTTGGGYIGVELSQVLANLGSHVTYVIRGQTVLQHFDTSLTEVLMPEVEKLCRVVKESAIIKVTKLTAEDIKNKGLQGERSMNTDELKELFTPLHKDVDNNIEPDNIYGVYAGLCKDGDGCPNFLGYYDMVLSAVGRTPATHIMNVPTSHTTKSGHIQVNEMGQIIDTNHSQLFAVGDALGKADLTPVAINYGRRLSDWLFGSKGENPLIFSDRGKDNGTQIPTVVFSHPPIGTCGLSTKDAIAQYGESNVRVWNAKFTPMYCSLLSDKGKFQSVTKIITTREFCKYTQQEEDIVIGIHMCFPGADECMQGFAIAVANRLPKSFIDNTIAIHPSAAEELVLFR